MSLKPCSLSGSARNAAASVVLGPTSSKNTIMSAEASTSNGPSNGITEGNSSIVRLACSMLIGRVHPDEAALYDRQIRLWGVEAQNRLVVVLTKLLRYSEHSVMLLLS